MASQLLMTVHRARCSGLGASGQTVNAIHRFTYLAATQIGKQLLGQPLSIGIDVNHGHRAAELELCYELE